MYYQNPMILTVQRPWITRLFIGFLTVIYIINYFNIDKTTLKMKDSSLL